MVKAFKFLSTGVAIAAIALGVLFSSIPTKLGLYQWLASRDDRVFGLTPAFHYGIEWGYSFQRLDQEDLTGQTALITGANSGIGYETALALARLGASVTLACRNPSRCKDAADKIRSDKAFKGEVTAMIVDTSDLQSVKDFSIRFVEANGKLDMLFLNAGIGSAGVADDGSAPLSKDGVEMVFATNVLGHHLIYKYVEPLVKKSPMSRIVLTSSAASFNVMAYKVPTDLGTLNSLRPVKNGGQIYGQSKLAQLYWAKELTKRLGADSNIYVNAFHPGAVNTAIWDKNPLISKAMKKVFNYLSNNVLWNATEGALTMLYLGVATDDLKKGVRGKYFHPQAHEVVNSFAMDESLQKKLWVFLDDLVNDYAPSTI